MSNSAPENVGFNIAHFLWIMKGSNKLDEIKYYSKAFNKMSDDETTLRGAYGPRLRYWVGADQLQEATDNNKNIEDEKEYKKPVGVDQLQMVFNDLKNGHNCSCCQIFDPSIDFENSNYIPDLMSIGFTYKEDKLNITGFYLKFPSKVKHFQADVFFLDLMGECMASILGKKMDVLMLFELEHNSYKPFGNSHFGVTNKTPETLWHDIHQVFNMERFMRNHVTKETVKMNNVDVLKRLELGMKEYIDKITCKFWADCGYILLGTALKKYGSTKYDEWIRSSLLCNISSATLKGPFEKYLECENGRETDK